MRVSRVNKNRISDIIVSRKTVVNSVDNVNSASPVFAVDNDTTSSSEGFWLSNESFYERLNKQSEQTFEEGKENHLPDHSTKLIHSDDDQIVSFIHEFISHFNHSMDNLLNKSDDKSLQRVNQIIHTVTMHNRPLSVMGIMIDRKHHLTFKQELFLATIKSSSHHLKLLLDPEKGILRKIYDSFTDALA